MPTDWPDPRGVALEMQYQLCPVRVGNCGGEATDDRRILYRPSVDKRAQGTSVWHGIAHCILRRHYPDAGEADAWLLTGALVVDRRYSRWSADEVVTAQPFATRWLIEQRLYAMQCETVAPWESAAE